MILIGSPALIIHARANIGAAAIANMQEQETKQETSNLDDKTKDEPNNKTKEEDKKKKREKKKKKKKGKQSKNEPTSNAQQTSAEKPSQDTKPDNPAGPNTPSDTNASPTLSNQNRKKSTKRVKRANTNVSVSALAKSNDTSGSPNGDTLKKHKKKKKSLKFAKKKKGLAAKKKKKKREPGGNVNIDNLVSELSDDENALSDSAQANITAKQRKYRDLDSFMWEHYVRLAGNVVTPIGSSTLVQKVFHPKIGGGLSFDVGTTVALFSTGKHLFRLRPEVGFSFNFVPNLSISYLNREANTTVKRVNAGMLSYYFFHLSALVDYELTKNISLLFGPSFFVTIDVERSSLTLNNEETRAITPVNTGLIWGVRYEVAPRISLELRHNIGVLPLYRPTSILTTENNTPENSISASHKDLYGIKVIPSHVEIGMAYRFNKTKKITIVQNQAASFLYRKEGADIIDLSRVLSPDDDSDGDGVPYYRDACPTEPGSLWNNGCPLDSDRDGLPDSRDSCPTVAGFLQNHGCPLDDTDRDGVVDKYDKCPDQKGPLSNKGCPVTDSTNSEDTSRHQSIDSVFDISALPAVLSEQETNTFAQVGATISLDKNCELTTTAVTNLPFIAKILQNHPMVALNISTYVTTPGEKGNKCRAKTFANKIRKTLYALNVPKKRIQIKEAKHVDELSDGNQPLYIAVFAVEVDSSLREYGVKEGVSTADSIQSAPTPAKVEPTNSHTNTPPTPEAKQTDTLHTAPSVPVKLSPKRRRQKKKGIKKGAPTVDATSNQEQNRQEKTETPSEPKPNKGAEVIEIQQERIASLTNVMNTKIQFKTGRAKFINKDNTQKAFEAVAKFLNEYTKVKVVIRSEFSERDDKNEQKSVQSLAKKRADKVTSAFKKLGIAVDRVVSEVVSVPDTSKSDVAVAGESIADGVLPEDNIDQPLPKALPTIIAQKQPKNEKEKLAIEQRLARIKKRAQKVREKNSKRLSERIKKKQKTAKKANKKPRKHFFRTTFSLSA